MVLVPMALMSASTLLARAFAQRHDRHHRGDADDDAEHGEDGAQPVRVHRQQRHARRPRAAGRTSATPAIVLVALAALPVPARWARPRGVGALVGDDLAVADLDDALGACRATFMSCVTMMMVWPSAFSSSRIFIISAPLLRVERAGGLVGQDDARRRSSARARSTTRCCWPPESWSGRCVMRSARPSASEQSARRARGAPARRAARIDRGHLDVAARVRSASR